MSKPIRIAQPRVVLTDPHDCTDSADSLSILNAVFDTLVRRKGRHHVPHLAKGWRVSPDARAFTFELREGLVFHDGHPLDAAAVCSNLARLSRPDKGYTLGAPGVWHQFLGNAEINAPDPHTVTIALPAPIADLCDVLSQCFMVSPNCFADFDTGALDIYIGSGRYRLISATPGAVHLTPNTRHFLEPAGLCDIHLLAVPDASDRLALLEQGRVDLALRLHHLPQNEAFDVQHHVDPVAIICLFNSQSGPLRDPALRRALNMAIDREALIRDVLDGQANPLNGFVSDCHFGAPQDARALYDPDAARRILNSPPYANGLVLRVDCPTRLPDEAEALTASLARQLAPFGVTLDVTLHTDREAYAHMVRRKEIGDMCVFDSSPMSTFRVIYEKLDARVAGSWWQGFHNPTVERLLDEARATPDDSEREKLYRQVYREVQQDPPWLFLYNPIRALGMDARLPRFEMPHDGVPDLAQVPCKT